MVSISENNLLLKELIDVKTHEGIDKLLQSLIASGQYCWSPLGNKPGNASHVQLISDPYAALVERITNSFDALIERQLCSSTNKMDISSPRDAVEKLFDIPKGRLDELDPKEREILGNEIRIIFSDSGKKFMPTVIISDSGIGQHPLDFPRTFLSLGESTKLDKYYLCGSFGQGGASTLWFCDYTIIISRRRPEHLDNGYQDMIGWTIIRKNKTDIRYKNYTYEYLAVQKSNEKILVPYIPIEKGDNSFLYGTMVKHIEFEIGLGKYYPTYFVGMHGYRIFSSILFDPILPFSIEGEIKRTIPGVVARLRSDARNRVEYQRSYDRPLNNGKLTIRYWVLKSKPRDEPGESNYLDSYLDKTDSVKTIIITLNGQRHGYLEKEFVKTLGLPYLRDYLLVHVDCDNLPIGLKREIFQANRNAIKEGEIFELIKEVVKEALDDEKLKQLNEKRREQQFNEMDEETEKNVRNILNKLIRNYLNRGMGQNQKSTIEIQYPDGKNEFEPAETPTYLTFQEDEDPVEIEQESKRIIPLLTDASNDYLTQRDVKFRTWFTQRKGLVSTLGKIEPGIINVTVNSPSSVLPETEDELNCELILHNGSNLEAKTHFLVIKKEPLTPYSPLDPPTILKILGSNILKLKAGRKNKIRLELNGPDDLFSRPFNNASFEIYCSIPGAEHVGTRGLSDGKMQPIINIPENVVGLEGFIRCTVTLSNSIILKDEKPCVVVKPNERKEIKFRKKFADEFGPKYKVQPIFKDNWSDQWNENKIGDYVIENDGSLTLYINLDAAPVEADRNARLLRGEEQDRIKHIINRYLAHMAFHLYKLYYYYEIEKPEFPSGMDIEPIKNNELSRVADSLLLALNPISQL